MTTNTRTLKKSISGKKLLKIKELKNTASMKTNVGGMNATRTITPFCAPTGPHP